MTNQETGAVRSFGLDEAAVGNTPDAAGLSALRIAADAARFGHPRSLLSDAIRRFASSRVSLLGFALLIAIIAIAIAAPAVASADPAQQNIGERLRPPAWLAGGASANVLGTDQLGRDLLARVVYGARTSLLIGLAAAMISAAIGISVGLAAGYWKGWLGDLLMRLADIQHAFPFLVLGIAVMAVLGPGLVNLIGVLAIAGWVSFARITYGEALSVRERDYVLAARMLGASELRTVLLHILPNVISPVIIIWTFVLAHTIITESSLSFLGLGLPPPTPSWGGMLADGRVHIATAWWVATFPGIAIMLTVLAINLVGDGLRDALDPRLRT